MLEVLKIRKRIDEKKLLTLVRKAVRKELDDFAGRKYDEAEEYNSYIG